MRVLTRRFVKKVLIFYGYILVFLVAVLAMKVVLSGAIEPLNLGGFLSLMAQPLNIYVWAFVTVMYFVFVLVVAGLLKGSSKKS